MRTWLWVCLALLLCISTLVSCNANQGENGDQGHQGTQGLAFYPLPNGTYGVKTGTTQYLEEIVIPSEYNHVAVTQILGDAFRGAINLKKITIPDSVTSIGSRAFDCSSLTDIYFTGTETGWNAIDKSNAQIPSDATVHFNYIPE